MSLFNFNQEEMLTFFAILIRYSVLVAILPFLGDRVVPMPVKVLLSLSLTIALMPALVSQGFVHPGDAVRWGSSVSGIVGTVAVEAIFALVLGYTARLAFETISFGGHLVGTFMGFGMASTYDPQQESQAQVVATIHTALATLLFLVLDAHHLMLKASLESYQIFGLGGGGSFLAQPGFNVAFSEKLVAITGQVIRFALQMSAPVAVVLFAVNVVFGVLSKAMPQINVLVLSVGVSGLIGLVVLFLSLGEFDSVAADLFERMVEWMQIMTRALSGK